MSYYCQRRNLKPRPKRSRFFLLLLILFLVIGFGRIMAEATEAIAFSAELAQSVVGTVDPVPPRYQLGQEIYLENCGSCHIALPPQVMPTQTWQGLLQDSEHYGIQIPLLKDPNRLMLWNYLQVFSRPVSEEEPIPYRMAQSRYFKALHPLVKLPRPLNPISCATCHPQADNFNFRSLAPNWEGDRRDP
jgi:hypothetical protein